jgi:FtsH-binding integral membrane protein
MADFDNRLVRGATTVADTMDAGLRAHMLRVYNYMTGALALTGIVAYGVANTPALLNLFYREVDRQWRGAVAHASGLGGDAGPDRAGACCFPSASCNEPGARRRPSGLAALVGASLASISIVYTGASVAMTFFVTAGTFGAMSLWGYTTKRDLTGFGSFLFMGLIGILLASLANFFFKSAALSFVISVLGVLIFTGLTAWDTQKIKNTYYAVGGDTAVAGKAAIMGALALYLDFLNIFLFLLRFMGNRR